MVMQWKQQIKEGDESGKTREHLEPKRRVGARDSGREGFQKALLSLSQAKERRQILKLFSLHGGKKRLSFTLKYTEFLLNSHLHDDIKANHKTTGNNSLPILKLFSLHGGKKRDSPVQVHRISLKFTSS